MARFALLLLVAAVALAAAAPSANGQLLRNALSLTANVFCTETGNPCTNVSAPVQGLVGNLICNGVTVGSGVTNANGTFLSFINPIPARLLGATCTLVFPLSDTVLCPALRGTGFLSVPVIISSVLSLPRVLLGGLLTRVIVIVAGPLTRVLSI